MKDGRVYTILISAAQWLDKLFILVKYVDLGCYDRRYCGWLAAFSLGGSAPNKFPSFHPNNHPLKYNPSRRSSHHCIVIYSLPQDASDKRDNSISIPNERWALHPATPQSNPPNVPSRINQSGTPPTYASRQRASTTIGPITNSLSCQWARDGPVIFEKILRSAT